MESSLGGRTCDFIASHSFGVLQCNEMRTLLINARRISYTLFRTYTVLRKLEAACFKKKLSKAEWNTSVSTGTRSKGLDRLNLGGRTANPDNIVLLCVLLERGGRGGFGDVSRPVRGHRYLWSLPCSPTRQGHDSVSLVLRMASQGGRRARRRRRFEHRKRALACPQFFRGLEPLVFLFIELIPDFVFDPCDEGLNLDTERVWG